MFTSRTSVIIALLFFPYLAHAVAAAGAVHSQGGKPLSTAIRAIRKQEDAVRNISYTSAYCAYGTYSGKTGLVLSEKLNADSTYDGLPRGRYRIEVLRDLARWTDGPAPFSVNIYASAYNGRVSTFLKTGSGTAKALASVAVGAVGGRIPRTTTLGLYRQTGWNASIFGFTSNIPGNGHPRFSTYISPTQKSVRVKYPVEGEGTVLRVPTVRASWKLWHRKRYLRVVRIGYYRTEVFLLDPRKGFSISGYRSIGWTGKKTAQGIVVTPQTFVGAKFSVDGFYQPVPGVFFPRSVRAAGFAREGGKVTEVAKWSVAFSHVQVNGPAVTGDTYVIAFPRGAVVHDMDTGQSLQIGGTTQQQLREIERAVRAAR